MKGDDSRAEQLARFLDGGPVAEEIEVLLPAVRRVRNLLDCLAPDSDRIAVLQHALQQRVVAGSEPPAIELAHPTLSVRDMAAALQFYRDVLGSTVREAGKHFAIVYAGNAAIGLRTTARPRSADTRLEFRTADLDQVVVMLRRHGICVDVKVDRSRGRYAELRDPDGHLILLFPDTDEP